MNKLLVVGVAGQKRVGKDTLADYLATKLTYEEESLVDESVTEVRRSSRPWWRCSFAGAVKRTFCDAFGFDQKDIDKWKILREPPPGFEKNVRNALTFIGDGFRSIKPNVWIERAFRDAGRWHHSVFSDARYINEAKKIKSVGGFLILLYGHEGLNYDESPSEAELRPYISWCLNTGREGLIAEWPEFRALVETNENHSDKYGSVGQMMAPCYGYTDEQKATGEVPNLKVYLENLSLFDIFVLNTGSIEQFYEKIDREIVPMIKNRNDAS